MDLVPITSYLLKSFPIKHIMNRMIISNKIIIYTSSISVSTVYDFLTGKYGMGIRYIPRQYTTCLINISVL